MQQQVTPEVGQNATVCSMQAADYWRLVGAPKLRARKKELGRSMSAKSIGAAVEVRSGKSSGRVLVQLWLKGQREPYVSQLVALCEVMEVDLDSVLASPTVARRPLIHSALTHKDERKVYRVRRTK